MSDLIDRQAAIDAIEFGITYAKAINKETGEVKELFQASNDELRKAEDRIKQLPSAQQDTPTVTYGLGKWIEKEDDVYHGGGYTECSVCGQRYSWGGYFEANEFRYCPRCGHRMEVQEDV